MKLLFYIQNDTHSQVESFNDKKWGNVGGVLRRNKLILREKEIDPNLLLLDAGLFSRNSLL